MRIGIIGSSGRLGKVLSQLLLGKHELLYCSEPSCDEEIIEKSDITFLCVPYSETEKILSQANFERNIVEVNSAKTPFISLRGKIISIHPLFGPLTYKKESFKKIIFINDISKDGSRDLISAIFSDFSIIDMNATEHDKLMSQQLVLPYVLSMLPGEMNVAMTYSSLLLKNLVSISEHENKEIVMDTIRNNPHSREVVAKLISELSKMGGI